MSKKPSQTSANKLSPLAVLAVGGTVGLVAFMTWSSHTRTSGIENQVSELTYAVSTLIERQEENAALNNQEAFQSAVEASIEAYAAQARQAEIDARFAPYDDAPEQSPDGQWIYGNLNARFTLVEFADTECIYCKRFHGTPKQLVDGSNGNVNWEYKHLTVMGETSVTQAQAAECIGEQLGNQAFWVSIHEIYERTGSGGSGAGNMVDIAKLVGADVDDFTQCMRENRHRDAIEQDTLLARSQGISGTPATMVVDNQTGNMQLLGGMQPPEAFVQTIRRMMTESEEAGS